MRIKPIKQKNSTACGPTCIFMVINSFGDKNTLRDIEKLSNYKKTDGMDDAGIAKVFDMLGYRAEVRKNTSWGDLISLRKSGFQIIVSWMKDGYKGHVSVLSKITDKHIFLADPDVGKIIKIEKIRFMRLWLEYDGHWWPNKVTDINLRTLIKIKK